MRAPRETAERISIHALLAEGDARSSVLDQSAPIISIHALLAEGDDLSPGRAFLFVGFLSTPSSRRATAARSTPSTLRTVFLSTPSSRRATSLPGVIANSIKYFYPRPPRGGRHAEYKNHSDELVAISIHALLAEGDGLRLGWPGLRQEFLSTPSSRRATWITVPSTPP